MSCEVVAILVCVRPLCDVCILKLLGHIPQNVLMPLSNTRLYTYSYKNAYTYISACYKWGETERKKRMEKRKRTEIKRRGEKRK